MPPIFNYFLIRGLVIKTCYLTIYDWQWSAVILFLSINHRSAATVDHKFEFHFIPSFFPGHPRQRICSEGAAAAAAEAHDSPSPAGGHSHPGRVEMLCGRRAFRIGGYVEHPPGGAAQSASFVCIALISTDPLWGGTFEWNLSIFWGYITEEKFNEYCTVSIKHLHSHKHLHTDTNTIRIGVYNQRKTCLRAGELELVRSA